MIVNFVAVWMTKMTLRWIHSKTASSV